MTARRKKQAVKRRPKKKVARRRAPKKKVAKKAAKRRAKKKVAKKAPKRRAKKKTAPRHNPVQLDIRQLKRAPVDVANAELAQLGHALEVETPSATVRWRPGQAVLAWSPRHKALIIIEGGKRVARTRDVPPGRATGSFERWSGRGAKQASTLDVRPTGSWRSAGHALRIDYVSDKWGGRRTAYTHKTGKGVRLYVRGGWSKDSPRVWVLKGGRLTVTARGIVH